MTLWGQGVFAPGVDWKRRTGASHVCAATVVMVVALAVQVLSVAQVPQQLLSPQLELTSITVPVSGTSGAGPGLSLL